MKTSWFFCLAVMIAAQASAPRTNAAPSEDYSKLPANTWILIHSESNAGGKMFARTVFAPEVGRIYLWGTGGQQPARNVYRTYELEAFDPTDPAWLPAFPEIMKGKWMADQYPPFRIYGQSGPDGLKVDAGPRLQVVGGYNQVNRVWWWDFDGVKRPSPVLTFNQACWDSKRKRILYYSDGQVLALDPAVNAWTDLTGTNHPTTCRTVAWASMCYDSGRDQVLLFGGGLATNPKGGAPTWLYKCGEKTWYRPPLILEPPLRCNAPIVYDPVTQKMLMFGGYDQASALNDTWIYDCQTGQWAKREPKLAPPPMFEPAATLIPGGGKVLVCGCDARKVKLHHESTTTALKETWIYDLTQNTWTAVDDELKLPGYRWLTATTAEKHGVVLLVAFGPERRTFAFRYDPEKPSVPLAGAPPGSIAWKYPEQMLSLKEAPAPDPAAQAKLLASLPVNQFVNAQPPGLLISKTWSSAVMDTDRSEVIYTGGGHAGYSGNDAASYSIADNRWTLDYPPRFPPFLEGCGAGVFGWSYGMIPFSQHTYLWYAYDPQSKTMLYLARPSLIDGIDVQLTDSPADTFVYNSKQHGYASWVYDPVLKKMHRPSFGRPFANPWHLALTGTPDGVYAMCENVLYHGSINRTTGEVKWRLADADFPKLTGNIKYHYEYQPLIYDAQRHRLLLLKGDVNRVHVFARPLSAEGKWQQIIDEAGAIGREAVYIQKHDTILWLGSKLFALDCASNRVRELDLKLPEGLYEHECAMVYDPKHDVCVALIPRNFTGPMQTFLFRFSPKAARYHSP